ncbi:MULTISPECIES: CRISPR-associated endonuclease Cas1 [Bartonella]
MCCHPTLGVFHSHRANAFALADDLMEPYRPFVDRLVFHLLT